MTLPPPAKSSAGYKFNNFAEIKSHSSILFNERMAILFYWNSVNSMKLNASRDINLIYEVRAIEMEIYQNIRMLIQNNPVQRASLNLDTKEPGIYVTDVALGVIDKLLDYCEAPPEGDPGFTMQRVKIIITMLNDFKMMMHSILQYYSYFIRPDFRQKPDIMQATEKYKAIASQHTVDELRALVGKRNTIDFESIGFAERIQLDDVLTDNQVASSAGVDDNEVVREGESDEEELQIGQQPASSDGAFEPNAAFEEYVDGEEGEDK